jgi:hypothetical protein
VIRTRTALPVTCSHDLSSRLGGPRRALTTLLNARLISMVARLIDATSGYLAKRGIDAPLMVVRGDGALISAQEALLRPIETILSGPAASLVGARHLTGLSDAVVSDIGGTTTDMAVLEDGRPRLDTEGATVGRYRTMVEAVAMHTFGLGGDSEVRTEEAGLDAGLDPRAAPVDAIEPRGTSLARFRYPHWSGSCARHFPAVWMAVSRCAPAFRMRLPQAWRHRKARFTPGSELNRSRLRPCSPEPRNAQRSIVWSPAVW